MAKTNRQIVLDYIETIWNKRDLSSIDRFLSDDYLDHSLPPGMPTGKKGLEIWVINTSKAFEHNTIIESMVAERDEVSVRISFTIKHKGTWRNVPPTGTMTTVKGFRFFQVRDGMIKAHWGLIDGEGIQAALTQAANTRCEVPD